MCRRIVKRIEKFQYFLFISIVLQISLINNTQAQILFAEDCFVGGVTVAGVNRDGGAGLGNKCLINWQDDFELYKAYVVSFRYGRPESHNTVVNGVQVNWNIGNQSGPEQIEDNPSSDFFAPHAQDITDELEIFDDTLLLDFPTQTFYEHSPNWAWCSMYIVILYKSPSISSAICNRIYISDQKQDIPQLYEFNTPSYAPNHPVVLALFTSRLTGYDGDESRVLLNSQHLGDLYGEDQVIPPYLGAQGSFWYHEGQANGLNGDTANTRIIGHDATVRINDYLNNGQEYLEMYRLGGGWSNPHPAFTLTYTPECPVKDVSVERKYRYCRGGEMQLNAEAGYTHYAWTPEEGLSDPSMANPICNRDSSGWYQVRMWDDDGCSQTIPVHIEVTDYPVPENVEIASTICPPNTGEINLLNVPGAEPITYSANELENTTGQFTELSSGAYQLHLETRDGCTWDSLVHVPLNPIQDAAFTPSPESGYTPLEVFFENESSLSATHFTWLVNGIPFSNQEDVHRVFEDAGVYEIDLVAHRQEDWCADTASFTLFVDQGMELILPNIITPNSDGRNDKLIAQTAGVSNLSWTINDRWGREVHNGNTSNEDGEILLWDPANSPTGSYVVTITAVGVSGQTRQEALCVQVVR